MSISSFARPTGWRILGFGKHPEIAATVQEKLISLGFQATAFVLTNDETGDAQLLSELKRAEYDDRHSIFTQYRRRTVTRPDF